MKNNVFRLSIFSLLLFSTLLPSKAYSEHFVKLEQNPTLDAKTHFMLYLEKKGYDVEIPKKLILIRRFSVPSFLELSRKLFYVWHIEKSKEVFECITSGNCLKDLEVVRFPRKLTLMSFKPHLAQSSLKAYEEVKSSVARKIYKVSGKGVLVGLVDTGVEWSLKELSGRKKDLKGERKSASRVIKIWYQPERGIDYKIPEGLTYPSGFTFGWECSWPSPENPCPAGDDEGHGTHVAGIVGAKAGRFSGVAPDVLFISVRTNFWEYEALEAIRYIISVAKIYGLPVVVNLSLGGHFGPHDGTGFFENEVAKFSDEGVVITAAAGNEGDPLSTPIHVGDFIRSGTAVLDVYGDCDVEFWFDGNGKISVEIEDNSQRYKRDFSLGDRIVFEKGDEAILFEFSEGQKYFNRWGRSTGKDKNLFFISTYKFSGKIKISFFFDTKTRVDGWIANLIGCRFLFSDTAPEVTLNPSGEFTISVPATHPDVLAVCSYSPQSGKLSGFSSRGADWLPFLKPAICAPGEAILSLCREEGETCLRSGTSQSTPFLTGAIALAFQRNPNLTPADIKKILSQSGLEDNFTGQTPNSLWGYGKLQIDRFLANTSPSQLPPPTEKLSVKISVREEERGTFLVKFTSNHLTKVKVGEFYDLAFSLIHELFLPSQTKVVEFEDIFGRKLSFVLDFEEGQVRMVEGEEGQAEIEVFERQAPACSCSSFHTESSANLLALFIYLIALKRRKIF